MRYLETRCTVYVKKEIDYKDISNTISKLLNHVLCKKDTYKKLHEINSFKNYTFSSLLPLEKEKVYKRGKIYSFIIKTADENLSQYLSEELRQETNNSFIQIIETRNTVCKKPLLIESLKTVTPTIVTLKKENIKEKTKQWTKENNLNILKELIQKNLLKKYENFYNEPLNPKENFIQLIEVINRKPVFLKASKNNQTFSLLGNKFTIIPKEDEISQKLAFIALSFGIGEKHSYGAGYTIGRYIK